MGRCCEKGESAGLAKITPPTPSAILLNQVVEEALMVLADSGIKELIDNKVLDDANPDNIGPVSYDLTTASFYTRDGLSSAVALKPGESVFVSTRESIHLPNNLTARVLLRNSRIRQGLALASPLYFPGHETVVYFRVTNVSADEITLDTAKGIAQIVFERVDGAVEQPYEGAFSNEFDYRGLGGYEDIYAADIKALEKKEDSVKGIEKRMYGNVLALMAIFAAIFSLVNINVQLLTANESAAMVIVVNLATVGSFAFLAGIIAFVLRQEKK